MVQITSVSDLPAELPCGAVLCSNFTTNSCNPTISFCQCKRTFYGPTCQSSIYEDRADMYYGLFGYATALALLLLIFSLYVLYFYYWKYKPTQPKENEAGLWNPQLFGMWLVLLGALNRVAHMIAFLAVGPTVETLYYIEPSAMQLALRFTFGLFLPCLYLAYLIQILIWADFLRQTRHMQAGQAQKWVVATFCVGVAVVYLLEILTQFLLNYRVGGNAPRLAYFCIYLVLLTPIGIVTIIFGIRFQLVTSRLITPTNPASERAKQSKKNLTSMVLMTSFLYIAFEVIVIVMAVVKNDRPYELFIPAFFLRAAEFLAAGMICLTFLRMMQNRMDHVSDNAIYTNLNQKLLENDSSISFNDKHNDDL